MRDYPASAAGAPALVLAHGAGAGHDHPWMRRVAAGLAGRGVRVITFDFPYIEAGRRLPDRGVVLEDALASIWDAVGRASGPVFAGGKSMGARIASQLVARGGLKPAPTGLVFFGYPLHPPGKPAQRRDQHLPHIGIPMLFLHGARDPFGSPDEMRALSGGLPGVTLEIVEHGDHSLSVPKRQDPDGQSIARAIDIAAAWIRAHVPSRPPSGA